LDLHGMVGSIVPFENNTVHTAAAVTNVKHSSGITTREKQRSAVAAMTPTSNRDSTSFSN
jgi:hypothetical protein